MSSLGVAAGRTAGRLRSSGRVAGVRVRGTAVPPGRQAAVLLASEGRAFSPAAIARAAELAGAGGAVMVMATVRVHGTALGLPNPGLVPTNAEWDEQHDHVRRAVAKLRRLGVRAEGQVLGTRNAAKRICGMADEVNAEAIVMGADTGRSRFIGSMLWSQEPQAVARRTKLVVHLLTDA